MNSYKTWTIEEDKKLWQLYGKCKTKELAREMNRTEEAIRQRYFKIKRNGIPTKRRPRKMFKKANKCPACEGTHINTVNTYYLGDCIKVNFCLDCLHEFTEKGEIIPPLWKWEDEIL